MTEWKEVKVGELGKVLTGKTPKTSETDNYGGNIPFITPSDDMKTKYIYSTSKKLTEKGAHSVKNNIIPERTICVSCIGSDLGKVVISTERSVTNQQINSIIINEAKYDVDFIYYVMTMIGKIMNHHSKTSTAVPIVNKSQFSEYTFLCPELKLQKKIGEILSSIDSKIMNNEAINRNLSLQADTIYKEQFVTNSDESWDMGHLSDLITVKYGKDHKKLEDGVVPCYGSGGVMRYVEKPLYEQESVLIPRKGTLNNVMYVRTPFWSVDTMFYTVMKVSNVAKFIYHFVKEKDLAAMNAGSAVPSMTTEILNAMELRIPTGIALEQFELKVAPLYETINKNEIENNKLAELRDVVLPKLMSGELDVSDLDI